MTTESDPLAAFRKQVSAARSSDPTGWQASRQLVTAAQWPETQRRLLGAIQTGRQSELITQRLTAALTDSADSDEALKSLTGLPATKALRALCVLFGVRPDQASKWPLPSVTPEAVEQFVRRQTNPFDLLLAEQPASVLELGAGDLSFAEALAQAYVTPLATQQRPLIFHGLDRLDPNSQLGGPLHAPPPRLAALRSNPGLQFRFYGNQDLCALTSLDRDQRLASRYLIATCWAPATPTFAYEPTRLSAAVIEDELRRTKGVSRVTRHGKEPALEVLHGGKSLLFPAWKFDIRGPLALLETMATRSALCVLGAVDSQVFWEILSQLIDDPAVRPADVILSPDTIPALFGHTYEQLSALPIGGACKLADLTPLRRSFPCVLPNPSGTATGYRFRSVTIRRGALFDGIPASSTARRFSEMTDETPPWFLALVPEPTTTRP